MARDATAFGCLIGALLDRSASSESGSAKVSLSSSGRSEGVITCYFRGIDVWRVESQRGHSVSDGQDVWSWKGVDDQPRRTPARRGHPPYAMQMCFPSRAGIWGRVGDDYYMDDVEVQGEVVRIGLVHMEDDRLGHVLADPLVGVLREFVTPSTTLRLEHLSLEPQPDSLFSPRNGGGHRGETGPAPVEP